MEPRVPMRWHPATWIIVFLVAAGLVGLRFYDPVPRQMREDLIRDYSSFEAALLAGDYDRVRMQIVPLERDSWTDDHLRQFFGMALDGSRRLASHPNITKREGGNLSIIPGGGNIGTAYLFTNVRGQWCWTGAFISVLD